MNLHRAGTVSVRFPECPERRDLDECRDCREERCHDCQGWGRIDYDGIADRVPCQACAETGFLQAQLEGLHDPEAAQAEYRARKGWAP